MNICNLCANKKTCKNKPLATTRCNEKFTQGEWRLETACQSIYIIKDKRWQEIASVNHINWDYNTICANAALIAAAPEMYRMLKYLADGVRWGGIQHTDRSLAAEIEKLLKKARGEE